jgi:aryl-alcohol dehydrogenase-like predicted oxidoreductase
MLTARKDENGHHRNGVDVSPLALGGTTFGWTSDETTSRQVLDSFLDAGGNLHIPST